MEQNLRRPGPVGTSCLTCKRRRKKCDATRPACERCTTSGLVCLGYAHLNRDSTGSNQKMALTPQCNEEGTQTADNVQPPYTLSPNSLAEYFTPLPTPSFQGGFTASTLGLVNEYEETLSSAQLGIANDISHSSWNGDSSTHVWAAPFESDNSHSSWLSLSASQSNNPSPLVSHQPVVPYFAASNMSSVRQYPSDRPRPSVFPSPTGLSPVSSDVAQVIKLVISQQDKMISMTYFTPSQQQIAQFRESLILRLQGSSETRYTMLLGCKIMQSLFDGTSTQNFPRYYRWLERFEEKLYSTSDRYRSPTESQDRLTGALEVAFLRLRISDYTSTSSYQLLRNSRRIFIEIARAEGALKPDTLHPSVSLAHIFAATRHELTHFVLLDSMCSMLYALPQVVEYDTSISHLELGFHPAEWGHGCPIELQNALVDINALFNHQRITSEPDWQRIERRIKSWQPIAMNSSDNQSWKTVARLAVQESWRHTLLVYLYMMIDSVSSKDHRVQASVRQVFQLVGTIKHSEQPFKIISFLPQFVIVGACARSEKQRALVRERLQSPSENNVWLFRGNDFIPVLDHLWHGAAANGRSIRWKDYAHSRRVAYPIPI